jgi:hypothetical protein
MGDTMKSFTFKAIGVVTVFFAGLNLSGVGVASTSGIQEPCHVSGTSIDKYLGGKHSPMVGQGATLNDAGKQYNVDPRLLVAIAGAETGFGNKITAGQFNAFNWLYNGGTLNSPFTSWQRAIISVAHGLSTHYDLTNTTTMYSQYCTTGNTCDSGLKNVNLFMNQQGAKLNSLQYPCR